MRARLSVVLRPEEGGGDRAPDFRRWRLALGAIVVLGAALRLYDLGSELWLDEIATVLTFRDLPVLDVLTSYPSNNNHLTNTLLVKGAVALWGLQEWAIRLPAAVFGIAGVPAQYFLARWILPRRYALLAALLLAVSYHHIFFSQNARGYTAYLLWAALGTGCFLNGVTRNRPRDWVLYVLTMLLAVAAVLIGVFVVTAHILAFGVALWTLRHSRSLTAPLIRSAAAAWIALGLLIVLVYAGVLPRVWATVQGIHGTEAVGYAAFSREYLDEIVRGLSQGLGPAAGAGAVMLVVLFAAAAAHALWRRPVYSTAMLAPLGLTAFFLLAAGARFSPRFFLWSVPVVFILAVDGAASLSQAAGTTPKDRRRGWLTWLRWAPEGLTASLVVFSLWSLGAYYATPKQPSRTVVEWIHHEAAEGDVIVPAYLAKAAFLFYGPAYGRRDGEGFSIVHEREELLGIEARHQEGAIWVVTTFPRALGLEYPDLYQHVVESYRPVRTFSATIGDGAFTIWAPWIDPVVRSQSR